MHTSSISPISFNVTLTQNELDYLSLLMKILNITSVVCSLMVILTHLLFKVKSRYRFEFLKECLEKISEQYDLIPCDSHLYISFIRTHWTFERYQLRACEPQLVHCSRFEIRSYFGNVL